MASFQKFYQFAEDLGSGAHDLENDTLKVLLTNTAPDPSTDLSKDDIDEIAAGNGYVADGFTVQANAYTQTGGVGKLVADDILFTASGGDIGPFRYAVLYNATSPLEALIGFWDYGSSKTLHPGDSMLIDFDQAAGVLTVT